MVLLVPKCWCLLWLCLWKRSHTKYSPYIFFNMLCILSWFPGFIPSFCHTYGTDKKKIGMNLRLRLSWDGALTHSASGWYHKHQKASNLCLQLIAVHTNSHMVCTVVNKRKYFSLQTLYILLTPPSLGDFFRADAQGCLLRLGWLGVCWATGPSSSSSSSSSSTGNW